MVNGVLSFPAREELAFVTEIRGASLNLCGVERRKPALEIGFEIVDILKTNMESQRRAAGAPFGGSAIGSAIEGNGEALEAAP